MYIEYGMGRNQIVYYNADKSLEVEVMLKHIACAYNAMIAAGYPGIINSIHRCRVIFTDEERTRTGLVINISTQPYGIYANKSAYSKQIAKALFTMTGINIYEQDCTEAAVEIGMGGIDAQTQGYVILKDAILEISNAIF